MTLRPRRLDPLSSPSRLSIVCLHQIVGLPSHAGVWHRFAIQFGVGHSGHQETGRPGASRTNRWAGGNFPVVVPELLLQG